MQNENAEIAKRIRGIRLEKNITQSELDKLAGLPQNATSKIESCKRELSATDLQRISKVLGVSTDTILKNDEKFIYQEEVRIIQGLREVSFDLYKRVMSDIEMEIYYKAKYEKEEKKQFLQELAGYLYEMAKQDVRPRSALTETKRGRK